MNPADSNGAVTNPASADGTKKSLLTPYLVMHKTTQAFFDAISLPLEIFHRLRAKCILAGSCEFTTILSKVRVRLRNSSVKFFAAIPTLICVALIELQIKFNQIQLYPLILN